MGAEGARVKYPYLSGQWTELKQYDDTFRYGYIYMQNYIYSYIYTCEDDYTILFFIARVYFDMLWLFYLLT